MILAGLALANVSACGRGGEAETAVFEASVILKTGAETDVATRGSNSASDSAVDFRVRRLEEALAKLSPHVGAGDSPYEGAAAVLAAVAQNGLAIEDEARIITQMRELDNRMTVLRGVLGEWWKYRAVSEASLTFDPKDSVEELNQLTTILQDDVEQISKSKALLDEKIASLRAQIDEAMAQGDSERTEASRVQLESNRADPTAVPELAERVREHTRRADSYEFQAQRLRTRLSQIEPDAEEKAKHIERLQTQLRLLEESRQQIADRVRTSADDAAAARRAASKTEATLLEQGGALNDAVVNDLGELASNAERRLRSAITAAGQASDATRDSANLAKASAQHRLGDLHTSVANAHESLSDLFAYMGSLALENASRFRELGEARKASGEQARQSAKDAYAGAARSLRGVRVRTDAKDALNALADQLEGVEPESLDEFGSDEMEPIEVDPEADPDAMGDAAPEPDDGDGG